MPLSNSPPSLLFAGLNPLDWLLVALLTFSAVTAFLRGLIRSVISLAGVVLGLLLAAWYTAPVAAWLAPWIHQPLLAEVAAFAGILIVTYLLATLTGRLLRSASQSVGLGFIDRLGGAAFGLVRAVLLLAAILLPLTPFLPLLPLARNSRLLPYLRTAAHGVSFVVPQDFGDRLAAEAHRLHRSAPASPPHFAPQSHRNTAPQSTTEGENQ